MSELLSRLLHTDIRAVPFTPWITYSVPELTGTTSEDVGRTAGFVYEAASQFRVPVFDPLRLNKDPVVRIGVRDAWVMFKKLPAYGRIVLCRSISPESLRKS